MLGRSLLICLVLIVGSVLIGRAAQPEPVALPIPFARFPSHVGEWRGIQQPALDDKARAVLGADDYLSISFSATDRSTVGLFVGYWSSQRQGDTIHSPLNCLPGAGWEPLSRRTMLVPYSPAHGVQSSTITVNRYVVQKGLERQMVLYWYQSHGRVVASEYWSKFFLVTDAIRTRRTDAAVVRVNTPVASEAREDEDAAERLASQFVQTAVPILNVYLPG